MRRQLVRWVVVIFVTMLVSLALSRVLVAGIRSQRGGDDLSDATRLTAHLLAEQASERTTEDLGAWSRALEADVRIPVLVDERAACSESDLAVPSYIRGPGGHVRICVPAGSDAVLVAQLEEKNLRRPEGWTLLAPISMMFLVSVVAATLLLLPTVRRLDRLRDATAAIGAGKLDTHVDVGDEDAIGDLERHFNEMTTRIRSLLGGQRELLQAVAHEIRTPIARIRWAQELAATTADPEERAKRLAVVDQQVLELDELVSELLVFHRYDDGTAQIQRRSVSVRAVIEEVVEGIAARRPTLDIEIRTGPRSADGAGATVQAHPRSFERVLKNLVSNAVRHARGHVLIEVQDQDGGVRIDISDDGPGIPATDRERIFEPFARADPSRERESGGVGLGLAIVRRIMGAHGGSVAVSEADRGGARFSTTWPGTSNAPR